MLMPRRTIAMYEACLENTVAVAEGQYGITLQVPLLSIDFEKAAVTAFRNVFGYNVRIEACHFHLCKSITRRVSLLGLQRRYRQNDNFSLSIRMLAALAYVPVDEVPRLFRIVAREIGLQGGELVEYFKNTYVRGPPILNGLRGRPQHAQPAFPPAIWNCFDRFTNDMATTNNAVEAWHRRLDSVLPRAHPRIWAFLEKLKEEQRHTEGEIIRAEFGEPPRTKRRSVAQRAMRLRAIVDNAAGVYDVNYLRAVARNFTF
jgi:hypothetical protein